MTPTWQIVANERGVTRLSLRSNSGCHVARSNDGTWAGEMTARATNELNEYFAGRLQSFSVPVDRGLSSPFAQAVFDETARIPYGQVRTYTWIAGRLGKPTAARAVGNALARNPVPILIPCHRVVRKDGFIGRFALGSKWKKRLLELEKTYVKT